ncbi:hypothetical protein [Longicatena caecimuris]|uniref:Uncharacterized protein n=1 Tax=Longicatena caecimuris TaxID=1796635 RepID=A0A4R3TDF1_9FIRM|nr:hypothetical protein [Longicatena caecimuris]MCR1870215.1 hypothetical protein [Longicatena caecimuris]MCU0102732.1 hypothetical protein [Longicatena caecimuris]TCU59983.1 hypothetical protein EDD61_10920 [Longicatena caecimuris]
MDKRTLDKAMELDGEIRKIKRMLESKIFYIWNGENGYHNDRGHYTTEEIDAMLREILIAELEWKKKEFAEL